MSSKSKKDYGPGGRRDARRITDLDAMHVFIPYMMPNRTDSEVYINEPVDVTDLLEYVEMRNQTAQYKMTMYQVFVAAVMKTVILRPYLNRYILARRIFERDEVTASFIAKKQFDDKGEESMMIIHGQPDSTLDDIAMKIHGDVKHVREDGNELDTTLDFLKKLPRWALKLFMAALRALDYYDKMPDEFYQMDPYHTTVLLSNLGSIKCGAVYHHLINFGTNSIVITIGEAKKTDVKNEDGSISERMIMEVGVTLDERIGDGFYFARSVKLLKHLVEHPHLLEKPFKEKIDYKI